MRTTLPHYHITAKSDRPALAKVIRRLESGDVLVVTRLDRLAHRPCRSHRGLPASDH